MRHVRNLLKLLGLTLLGGLLVLLRYILRTPQPLASALPGNEHIYKWTHGHIFYKVAGDISAPPLLLLHAPGVGSSAYEMLPFIDTLAQHYRVYAPDLLGFGLSDHPSLDYNTQLFATLYQDFLRDVVKRPALLFASGSSCNYAIATASRAPALCTQLILHLPLPVFRRSPQLPWLRRLTAHTLPCTFVYALLTPHILLRQVIAWQRMYAGESLSAPALAYAYAVAHQLGAQYAALASITGALDLDVTLQLAELSQPLLLLSPSRAAAITGHYTLPQQAQELFMDEEALQSILAYMQRRQEDMQGEAGIVSVTNHTSDTDFGALQTFLPDEQVLHAEEIAPEVVQDVQPAEDTSVKVRDEAPTIEAFCVKCKQKRFMSNAREIVTKNGRHAMEGLCPVCSTKLFRFIAGSK